MSCGFGRRVYELIARLGGKQMHRSFGPQKARAQDAIVSKDELE